jgi:hypothetical protein
LSGCGQPAAAAAGAAPVLAAGGPWLAPLQPAFDTALAAWRGGAPVAQALHLAGATAGTGAPAGAAAPALAAGPLRFVAQQALPAGEAYEAFIHRSAQVPTRDNAHDFFNGLVWLAQPALKRRLNELQAAQIAACGIGHRRGPVRDALTLFDENGALLAAPPPLADALRRRDWRALFTTHRGLWAQARLQIVGHALLEKLATAPRKPLTAHVLMLPTSALAGADVVAAALALSAAGWAAKPFHPLPVLGVPGWWPANADPAFYDDAAVFRPPPRPGSAPIKPAKTHRSTGSAHPCRS